MAASINRRGFIGSAAVTGASACLATSVVPGTTEASVSAASVSAASGAGAAAAASEKAVVEWPVWNETDEKALLDVLNSGKWGRSAAARRLPEFEATFAAKMRARHCIATASGTTALLTVMGALGIGPGDEVILPPYTFVATFNAITSSYALPVFVDSDAESFQIDPKKIDSAVTSATKLLLPVHIGGSPADLDAIMAVARERKLPVIEDACQAPLAEWRGQPVGTIGLAGCFSFQASKNLTSGEGGAILTNDETFANQCYNFHTPGGGRPAPSSGRGANYRLTEFQAGLLLSQWTRFAEQSGQRDTNAAYLTKLLEEIPGISPARLTAGCTRSGWHLYMLRYDRTQFANLSRAGFLKELGRQGISASGGYSSLNNSNHVRALAGNPHYIRIYGKEVMENWVERNQCPVNDLLCEEAVWFTQTRLLGPADGMDRIADVIRDIQKRSGDLAKAE